MTGGKNFLTHGGANTNRESDRDKRISLKYGRAKSSVLINYDQESSPTFRKTGNVVVSDKNVE